MNKRNQWTQMQRSDKIFLAYQRMAKNTSHIEALLEITRLFDISIFEASALVKEKRK
jgi:hypothetical protein